ncbi:MmgE/PrpD family protein [Variovorax sp. HJSM1_2]|uniref:MmgE/PrpD family protein n=1 Tax=Variovorax sp. HJSM1_2 TaxID=3366263 RepID=UPI003BE813CF
MTTSTNVISDLCEDIADYVITSRFEKLTPSVVTSAKMALIDHLGVTLAASGLEPAVQSAIAVAREAGGKPESVVIGCGFRTSAVMAAFANGAMAHCLDFDDQSPWGQHAGSSVLPAVVALAQRQHVVNGKDVITAIAIGHELFNRFIQNLVWKKDWNFSTVVGVFCATASACHILKLSRDQTKHALGIALMQCSGTMEVINSVGSDLRAMYAGFSAKGAVLASLLAEKGVTGVPKVFEGPHGLFQMYFGGRYNREAILDGLGQKYIGDQTLFKRWPAVGTSHSHIHATIDLVAENKISPAEIQEIRVHVGDYHQLMCEPIASRRAPATLVDAKFSLPFLVAIAAAKGGMGLIDFTSTELRNPEVLATAQKVVPVPDTAFNWKTEMPLGHVEIHTTDGRIFARTGIDVPGSPSAPMDWTALRTKFEECNTVAALPRTPEQLRSALAMGQNLNKETDCTQLFTLLQ